MRELKTIKPFIPRSDTFKNYIDALTIAMGKTKNIYNERKYTVGDTDLPYRVINHWAKNHVLPEGVKSTGGWRKFTFLEVVWLKIVIRFRNFGFSLKTISLVRKQVMVFNKQIGRYPIFEHYVIKSAFSGEDSYIVALSNGNVDIGDSPEIELSKWRKPEDMLLISIKSILNEMGFTANKSKLNMPITPDEFIALDAISSNSKEVTIKKSKGKIVEVETTKSYDKNPSLSQINKDFRDSDAFGEMTVKYEKGKLQSAQIKKRDRLR